MNKLTTASLVLGIVALGSLAHGGCADNCLKLQDKICADLGAEDTRRLRS
jgi:hypothetical protein